VSLVVSRIDRLFRQSLWVKELPVIYGEQAAAFMEFVSAEYEARDWTPG